MKPFKRRIAIIAGHMMEHYDISLYGFFAVLLAPYFFPETSENSARIASFGAFAAGFFMRPLGAIIFGYIGDRVGRRRALLYAILFVTAPTFIIGLLPTYDEIGVTASIILVACRLAQGISVGGEFSGALVYVFEHNLKDRPAFRSGALVGSGFAGAVLGTAVGAFCTMEAMPSWGWRIPFLLGGVLGIFIYILRRNLEETAEFERLTHSPPQKISPLREVLRGHLREFLSCIVFGGANLVPLYLATVYMNSWLSNLGLEQSAILLNNTLALLASGFLIPLMGLLADRIGIMCLMKAGLALLGLLAIPTYVYVTKAPSYEHYILLQVLLLIGNAMIIAPLTTLLPGLFQPAYRYTGLSVSYTIGQAVLGGLTPLIASHLVNILEVQWAPGLLLATTCLIFYGTLQLVGPKQVTN